jgi:hypothetical protein
MTIVLNGMKWMDDDEATRILGIMVGNNIEHNSTVDLTLERMASYSASRQKATLKIIGKITIANSCLLSQAVFPVTHCHTTEKQITKMASMMNTITNPNNQPSSYITQSVKLLPRSKGGPPITLLDIRKMAHTLPAAYIHALTQTLLPTIDQRYVTEQIIQWGRSHKLHCLHHILSAPMAETRTIPTPKNNSKQLPSAIAMLRGWFSMGFAPIPPQQWTYEAAAQLNIFLNPLIRQATRTVLSQDQSSQYKHIRAYHVAELFDNYTQDSYIASSRVLPGNLRSNTALARLFLKPNQLDTVSNQAWDDLKAAIPPVILQALAAGTTPPAPGDWVINSPTLTNLPPECVYKCTGTAYTRYYQVFTIVDAITGRLAPNGIVLPAQIYGRHCSFRRVQVVQSNPNNNPSPRAALYYRGPVHTPTKVAWTQDPQFYPVQYESSHGTGPFKAIAKAYRLHSTETRISHLDTWHTSLPPNSPEQEVSDFWDSTNLSIYHLRTTNVIKDLYWKLLINSPYMGSIATSHLSHSKRDLSHAISAHRTCIACGGTIPCTPQHRFWDCTSVQDLKSMVRKLFATLCIPNPMTEWKHLPTVLSPEYRKTVEKLVATDITLAYIHAIWQQHNLELKIVERYLGSRSPPHNPPNPNPAAPQPVPPPVSLSSAQHAQNEYDQMFATFESRTAESFLASIVTSIHLTPHHHHTLNSYLDERGRPKPARTLALTPPLQIVYNNLTPPQELILTQIWAHQHTPECRPDHFPDDPIEPLLTITDHVLNINLNHISNGKVTLRRNKRLGLVKNRLER